MATIPRFRAIAKIGKIELTGFVAWLMWLFVHHHVPGGIPEAGHDPGHWAVAFVGRARAERTITAYQAMGMPDLVRARQRGDADIWYEPPDKQLVRQALADV